MYIQEGQEVWQHEVSKMSHIYTNSSLNPDIQSKQHTWNCIAHESRTVIDESQIASRAWTLQEHCILAAIKPLRNAGSLMAMKYFPIRLKKVS